ncbi:hypothetical protein F4780DRAFT_755292 [Xylariomycetidae sp. FL0641]|nr:hypothetical protein F4780DRAFT_755292 [Xylariomycetidae sp. FL0641]
MRWWGGARGVKVLLVLGVSLDRRAELQSCWGSHQLLRGVLSVPASCQSVSPSKVRIGLGGYYYDVRPCVSSRIPRPSVARS